MDETGDIPKAKPKEMLSDENRRAQAEENLKNSEILNSNRDLAEISRKYDCFFVHGIKETIGKQSSGIHNPMVEKEISWQDQLKVLMLLKPSISGSTIRNGSDDMMWSDLGIICNQGEIIPVPNTASTKTISIKQRVPYYEGYNPEEIDKRIEKSINKSDRGTNEFIINNMGIAGLYISNEGYNPVEYRPDELKELSDNLGLPVYIIEGGKIFLAQYTPRVYQNDNGTEYTKYRYTKDEEISIENILQSRPKLPSESKAQILQQFSEDSPFPNNVDWKQYVE